MKIKLLSPVFKKIIERIQSKFFDEFPYAKELPGYMQFGYDNNDYKYERNGNNIKNALLSELRKSLGNEEQYDQFIRALKGGAFNGKNLSDKNNTATNKEIITIDDNYLKVYLNYIVIDFDLNKPIKESLVELLKSYVERKVISERVYGDQIQLIEGKRKKNNSKSLYYYCHYSKDGEEIRNFNVSIDKTTNDVIVYNTASGRIYYGKIHNFDNHRSLYVQADNRVSIHIILYVGRIIQGDLLFGIITLIDNLGKAISTNAVFESTNGFTSKSKGTLEIIKLHLIRGNILRIKSVLETVRTLEELKNSLEPNESFSNLEGYYTAYLISNKRKLVIPFAIYINQFGIVDSWRKTKKGVSKSKGVLYNKDDKLATIDININQSQGRTFSEYRIILDTSNNKKNLHGFYTGVYCGFSVSYSNPRGGRICFIKQVNNKDNKEVFLQELAKPNIKIGSPDYLELVQNYPNFEKFFKGEATNDHLIETPNTFDY